MWARVVEIMLATFLAISSFIFPYPAPLWIFDIIVATWLYTFSFLSFYFPLRKIHLLNLLASFALLIAAFTREVSPPPHAFQNYAVLGLLLFMFVLVPSYADEPPVPWSDYFKKKEKNGD